MNLRLSDVGDDGVRVVHLCVSGDGMCGKGRVQERSLSVRRAKEIPHRVRSSRAAFAPATSAPGLRGLNSANLPSCTFARKIVRQLAKPTLAPSQRRLTRHDFDLAATRLLAAHHHQQLDRDLDSLEHASLEQRRYPLATGWEWHVGAGSRVCMDVPTLDTALRRPPLISSFTRSGLPESVTCDNATLASSFCDRATVPALLSRTTRSRRPWRTATVRNRTTPAHSQRPTTVPRPATFACRSATRPAMASPSSGSKPTNAVRLFPLRLSPRFSSWVSPC